MDLFFQLYHFLVTEAGTLNGLDLNLINYPGYKITIYLFAILITIVLIKLKFGRNQFSQKHSGYLIPNKYESDFFRKFTLFGFKIIFVIGLTLILVALANPFLPIEKKITVIKESRERVDLIDVSSSKGWAYLNTGKAAGEIGREAFLEFLKMRRGKNDNTSLWLFATNPWMVEDFITDDELYILEAEDAPYVMVDPRHPGLSKNDPNDEKLDIVAPINMIQEVDYEGSTRLLQALDVVIKYIDKKGSKNLKQKALLIETDAAVEEYPEKQLQELKKRNVGIYFLHIKPNELGERQYSGSGQGLLNAELLKKQVNQYGGKFYDVTDKKSIVRAYQDIDRLEAVMTESSIRINKVPLFQMFIFFGIVILTLAVTLVLLGEVFNSYP